MLPYFAQTQLDKPHDYVVYVFDKRSPDSGGPPKKSSILNWHAGEDETSKMMMLALTPYISTARLLNPVLTGIARIFLTMFTPASGGTRGFRTIILATDPWRRRSWESFRWIGGSTLL